MSFAIRVICLEITWHFNVVVNLQWRVLVFLGYKIFCSKCVSSFAPILFAKLFICLVNGREWTSHEMTLVPLANSTPFEPSGIMIADSILLKQLQSIEFIVIVVDVTLIEDGITP